MDTDRPHPSRRDILTGRALRDRAEAAGDAIADDLVRESADFGPRAGNLVRLETRAMATDFGVLMNPGPAEQVMSASDALDRLPVLEDQMTVYRAESELSRLNARAASEPVTVEPMLYDLLRQAAKIAVETGGAFDPTSGPVIALWRDCRKAGRVPEQAEVDAALAKTGIDQVEFDDEARTIRFRRSGIELNLGGIGKGYAIDRVGDVLAERGVEQFLVHGGHSSLFARGDHNANGGWPVDIANPLLYGRKVATLLLRDRGFSTSGTAVQHFRVGGQRYGHILDPRTGWPAESLLSASVVAQTAALADALSTAFFVGGVEKARAYCDNNSGVGALLIPPPTRGKLLEPVICGIPDEILFLDPEGARAD